MLDLERTGSVLNSGPMTEIVALQQQLEEEREARKAAERRCALQQKLIDADRREQYIGTLIDRMNVGVLELGLDGEIQFASKKFCVMTGYDQKELFGQQACQVLSFPNLVEEFHDYITLKSPKRSGGFELQIRCKNQEALWVLVSGTPVLDEQGKVVGSIGLHFDISEIKQMQNELISAKELAERSQRAEQEFLANISHELRTPINAMVGMSHLLLETKTSPEQEQYLGTLVKSGNLLQGLLADVLDIAKIDAGGLSINVKAFNLQEILQVQFDTLKANLSDRPIDCDLSLKTNLDSLLYGDSRLLNQILINLLSNAEKFTQEGRISIEVIERSRIGRRIDLLFRIKDTGIGIPEEDVANIFQNFKRVDHGYTGRYKGVGLGLAIVKKLVDQQGGSIELETKVGEGTCFSIFLSYMDSGIPLSEEREDSSDALIQKIQDLKVLAVEDNAINIQYLSSLLSNWGVSHELAENGQEAVDIAREKAFDLILMDLQMPVMNGYEAAQVILNEDNPNKHTPIIALTASALTRDRDYAQEVGMVDFLTKPYTPANLLENLSKYSALPQRRISMESEAIEEPGGEYIFSDGFDREHLQSFYSGDIAYTSEMFELFLSEGESSLQKISTAMEAKDLQKAKQEIHKIKPAFSMVGFTDLWRRLEDFEASITKQTEADHLLKQFESIGLQMQESISRVESEVQRMKSWLHRQSA